LNVLAVEKTPLAKPLIARYDALAWHGQRLRD